MRQYQPNTASIYYHRNNHPSVCIATITQLEEGKYSIRALDTAYTKKMLNISVSTRMAKFDNITVDTLPESLTTPMKLLGKRVDHVLAHTNSGKSTKTELERLAVMQQLVGRLRKGRFSLTPTIQNTRNKNIVTFDFLLTVPYSDLQEILRPSVKVVQRLHVEKTLHVKAVNMPSGEEYVVMDQQGNGIGYLPSHIEDFCRVQYQNRAIPLLRILNILDCVRQKEAPPYLVIEVRGEFLVNTLEDSVIAKSTYLGKGVHGVHRPVIENGDVVGSEVVPTTVRDIPPVTPAFVKAEEKLSEQTKHTKDKLMKKVQFVILACMNKDNVIGVNGHLPWHIPEDMELFKKLTREQLVIVGRKTFESLPKHMPYRNFIVVSGRSDYPVYPRGDSTIVVKNMEEAMKVASESAVLNGKRKVYVIGGANVYEQMIPFCHEAIITVCCNPVADEENTHPVFFPKLPESYVLQISPQRLCSNEHGVVFVNYYRNAALTKPW